MLLLGAVAILVVCRTLNFYLVYPISVLATDSHTHLAFVHHHVLWFPSVFRPQMPTFLRRHRYLLDPQLCAACGSVLIFSVGFSQRELVHRIYYLLGPISGLRGPGRDTVVLHRGGWIGGQIDIMAAYPKKKQIHYSSTVLIAVPESPYSAHHNRPLLPAFFPIHIPEAKARTKRLANTTLHSQQPVCNQTLTGSPV